MTLVVKPLLYECVLKKRELFYSIYEDTALELLLIFRGNLTGNQPFVTICYTVLTLEKAALCSFTEPDNFNLILELFEDYTPH